MALYIVTAVQFDATGEVEYVRWMGDNARGVIEIAGVVEAIDRGDIVEMRFAGQPLGQVSGGRLLKKLLPNGKATVAEATVIPGRTLFHLPRI